jgi:hypothetical protein
MVKEEVRVFDEGGILTVEDGVDRRTTLTSSPDSKRGAVRIMDN